MHMDSYISTNDTIYQPLKPMVCRFFKPKIKTHNSNGIVQMNKAPLYIDLDNDNSSYDIPNESNFFSKYINGNIKSPIKANESKLDSENESRVWKQNVVNLSPQSIKIETSPCEMDTAFVSLSSVESSSLSNFPQFSAPYSKSIQSLSDTEMHESSIPTPTPAPTPIVTDVYSLNKAYRSPTNPPKRRHSTSNVKEATVTEQFLVDLTDDEDIHKITNIFQIVKQVVPCQPAQLSEQWDLHSIESDSLTEPMLDDRDELDGNNSVFQPLLQPSVVLEAIELAHLPKRARRTCPKTEPLKETAIKTSLSPEQPREASVKSSRPSEQPKWTAVKSSRPSEQPKLTAVKSSRPSEQPKLTAMKSSRPSEQQREASVKSSRSSEQQREASVKSSRSSEQPREASSVKSFRSSEQPKEASVKSSRLLEQLKETAVRVSPRIEKRKANTMKTSKCSETSRTIESVIDSLVSAQDQNDLQSDCVIMGEEKLPPTKIRRHSRPSRQTEKNQKEITKGKVSQSMTNSNSNDKKYIYCFRCQKNYLTLCEQHSVTWILNDDIECPYIQYVVDGTYDKFFRDRRLPGEEKRHCQCQKNELEHIQMGMPREFSLRESKDSEIGVWTTIALNLGTIIGPYLGEIAENWPNHERTRSRRAPNRTPSKSEMSCLQYAFKSNWLRYINFTNDIHKANLKITLYENKTFYQTVKIIYPETELFVCKKLEYGTQNHLKSSNISSKDVPVNNNTNSTPGDKSKSSGSSEALTCSSASRTSDQTANPITIFDKDQLQYLGHLLLTTPSLGCPALNSLMRTRFPDKASVSDSHIDRVIRLHRLRPLCGLKSNLASRSEIEEIVELYRDRPRLTLVDCQKFLARRFPNKPLLDLRSIDRIVELNRCRKEGPECGPDFRVDKEILSETRSILASQPKLDTASLAVVLIGMFPDKRNMLSRTYVKFLINKFHLRRKCSNSVNTTVSRTASLSAIKKTSLSSSKTGSASASKTGSVSLNTTESVPIAKTDSLPKIKKISMPGSRTGPVSASKTDSVSMNTTEPVPISKTDSLPQTKKISNLGSISESKTDSVSVNKTGSIYVSKDGLTTLPCADSVPVSKVKSVTMTEIDLFTVSNDQAALPRSNSLVMAKSSMSKDKDIAQHRANSISIPAPNSVTKPRSCSMDDQMKAYVRSICLEDPTMSAPRLNSKLRAAMPSKPEVSDRVVLNSIRSIRQAYQLRKDLAM